MKVLRFRFLIGVIATFAACILSLGCGMGGGSLLTNPPTTAVTKTQNPLVAQYSINTVFRGQAVVEFGTDTSYSQSTSLYTMPGQWGVANILVAGMKPGTTYHMRATVTSGGQVWKDVDHTFTTAVPSAVTFPQITITHPSAGQVNPGVELLDLVNFQKNNLTTALVTDIEGNPIWYYDVGGTQGNSPYTIKLLSNGHMLVSIFSSLLGSFVLREIDLAGNTIRELTPGTLNAALQGAGFSLVQYGLHHDFVQLDNGHLIVIVSTTKDFTNLPGYPGTINVIGNALVDLDENWQPVWAWVDFDHLDINRHPFGLPDWTHSNAAVYTPDDGNLLLSMRNQSWVIKIDYQNGAGSGDVIWKLGDGGDFALNGGDPREWFYGQHFPAPITTTPPQMTLAIFDDGNERILDDLGDMCGAPPASPCYSRAAVFQIDESVKTATVQWEFLPGLFTFWGGSINQLPNGNIEFDMSQPFLNDPLASQIMEVTQEANPKTVWQMNIQGLNAYRGYRIPSLYPGVSW